MFDQLLADCLEDMGFKRPLADNSIFLRPSSCGTVYKYIATYVDDLCIIAKKPELLLEQLQDDPYNFNLKGSDQLNFHLGCGFEWDSDGTLAMDPSRYINKMVQSYEQMFGSNPTEKVQSPLERGNHPELDTTEFLNDKGIKQYQSLIESMK